MVTRVPEDGPDRLRNYKATAPVARPGREQSGSDRAARIERTVEAVVFVWEGTAVSSQHSSGARVRRRVEALCAMGVDIAVVSSSSLEALDRQLRARPSEPGHLWLCPHRGTELVQIQPDGPELPRQRALALPHSVRELFGWWEKRGLTGGLILVVGTVFDPVGTPGRAPGLPVSTESVGGTARILHACGGPAELIVLLDEQLRRRRHRRVPAVDEDPAWTIRETGTDPLRHSVTETLLAMGAAGFVTRGSVEEGGTGSLPLVLASGVYQGTGPDQRPLPGPGWTGLVIEPVASEDVRVLDLRTGVLTREETSGQHRLRSLRMVSASLPGVTAMRAEAGLGRLRAGPPLQPPRGEPMTSGRVAGRHWARVTAGGAGIGAVATQWSGRDATMRTVERLASYVAGAHRQPALGSALSALDAAEALGFDRLLAAHRAVWAARWDVVNVWIPDDPAAELALRFALFQLWSNVNRHDQLGVGARGLSGTGYAGHVFWDADVFVLPAMASIDPLAARAMVRYRLRRLAAARAHAQRSGRRGARFPWESADSGADVTPTSGYLGGRVVPILTGELEEHVTADVAWAATHYAEWCDDRSFLVRAVAPLLRDTARYWASRCRVDPDGRAHIDQVIGPDEYHDSVDDNAYTNVMARWNLRAAAVAGGSGSAASESRQWLTLAAQIVDGYDPSTGRYEQFAGYDQLEPLLIADVAPPPVAADVLLGKERVSSSQVIKQPDVLMLHHLVPDEVQPGSLNPNLDFYGPRTAHGSSLSPAITAGLLARAGRTAEALDMLRMALTLDLDDRTGTTATGLHMATLGGVWQAMLTGFAGVRVRHGIVDIDPRLPAEWPRVELRFRCLGSNIRLLLTADTVEVHSSARLRVRLFGQEPVWVTSRATVASSRVVTTDPVVMGVA